MKSRIHLFLSVVTSIFLMLFVSLKSYALDYTITFTGTDASTTIGSVIVQNLTKGTTVIVPAGNVLNLNDAPNAIEQLNADDEFIRVYPNPLEGSSTVSFFAKQAGSTQLNAFSIDGRKIAGIAVNLQTGINSFQLSLPKGAYAIQVVGNGYSYTAKMINQTGTMSKPEIAYIGTLKPAISNPKKSKSSASGITTMTYATGDQLLYKAVSDNYSTIVTDMPTASKTINFDFVACADADGNNYTIVTLGTQTWMVENLKTTRYRTGEAIGTTTPANKDISGESTPNYQWAYNGDENLAVKYGRRYTWYAVADSRNIAPTGWHVASDAEWTTLENYLITNGYNYDGTITGNKIAKSLAATTDWDSYISAGTIGNDLTENNTSGFTALPGGSRHYNGTFYYVGGYGSWWSSSEGSTTDAWYRGLGSNDGGLYRGGDSKSYGFSVRCVRDEPIVAVGNFEVAWNVSSCNYATSMPWTTNSNTAITVSNLVATNFNGSSSTTKYAKDFATTGCDQNTYANRILNPAVYLETTLTVPASKTLHLSGLDITCRTSGGDSQVSIQYSFDGTNFVEIDYNTQGSNLPKTIVLAKFSALKDVVEGTTVTFRIVPVNTIAAAKWGINGSSTSRGLAIYGDVQ